jgi:nitrate reductase gamma subunit
MNAVHTLSLVILPYVAVTVFVVGTVYRYRQKGFTVTSLSSQFLEGRSLFWGSLLFHVGILGLLVGHLVAFLVPGGLLAWNSQPVRLLVLEVTGAVFGVATLVGLLLLIVRRLGTARIRAVTTPMDVAIEGLLLAQVVLGLWVAVAHRWGSSWFASTLSPYLWSLARFSPETEAVFALPWVVKLHVIGGFLILLLFPFTRLVHFLVAPLHYVARPYQLVIWNWNPRTIRAPRP